MASRHITYRSAHPIKGPDETKPSTNKSQIAGTEVCITDKLIFTTYILHTNIKTVLHTVYVNSSLILAAKSL